MREENRNYQLCICRSEADENEAFQDGNFTSLYNRRVGGGWGGVAAGIKLRIIVVTHHPPCNELPRKPPAPQTHHSLSDIPAPSAALLNFQ